MFGAPLIKAQAALVLKVWKANCEFRTKDCTVEDFEAVHDKFAQVLKDIEARHRELERLRTTRQKLAEKLNELSTRARSGMRGYFGPKSSQYQQVIDTPPSRAEGPPARPSPPPQREVNQPERNHEQNSAFGV